MSRWPVLLVLGAQLAFATAAHAQAQMEFIPSLSLFTVFDDNVLARAGGSASRALQLRPSFEGNYESPLVRLLGLYSFDMQASNLSALNAFDARRHALGGASFRASPFTTLGVAARYDRSETPADIDIGLLGVQRPAERLEITPTVARRLGPRTTLSGGYDWITERLVDGERGELHIGRAGWSRDMTSRTSVTGSYVGRVFVDRVDHLDSARSHAALVSWSRVMTAGTRVTLSAGPLFKTYGSTGVEASAALARVTPRALLALDYWHGDTIVIGVAGPVAVHSVTSRLSWPLTPRVELATSAGASTASRLDDRSSQTYYGTLVGSWSPGGLYSIGAAYEVDFQDGSIRNPVFIDGERALFDERVLRHVFRVGVTVAPRYRRSILPPEEAARAKGVTR
ncbi:MAG: hypothetical protein ACRD3C_22720 [Vicinamibacterales bacterium]